MSKKGRYFSTLVIEDHKGKNVIEIQNDCSQIRIKNDDEDTYINVNKSELLMLADFIKKAVDNYKPEKKRSLF